MSFGIKKMYWFGIGEGGAIGAAAIAGANNANNTDKPNWLTAVIGLGGTAAQIISATHGNPVANPPAAPAPATPAQQQPIIIQQPAAPAANDDKKSNTTTVVIVVGVIVVVVLGLFFVFKK